MGRYDTFLVDINITITISQRHCMATSVMRDQLQHRDFITVKESLTSSQPLQLTIGQTALLIPTMMAICPSCGILSFKISAHAYIS